MVEESRKRKRKIIRPHDRPDQTDSPYASTRWRARQIRVTVSLDSDQE